MKFYIQGHRQFDSECLRHLPRKTDRNLVGYHERMNSQYKDYCLVCDELLLVNHQQHENLTEFTSLIFANVGLPNRFIEMGLYLGSYKRTPFGVHKDACGVLSFPILGKKKFRIWKPEFIRKNPKLAQATSYTKYKRASQVLECRPGDMTYWPSSAWHIAESDGSFSATWSLGIWVDKPLSQVVSEISGKIAKNLKADLGNKSMTALASKISDTGEIKSLPESYQECLTALDSAKHSKLDSEFRKYWLQHVSKNGFKNLPECELKLKAGSKIRLTNLNRPVRWMRVGTEIIYAFHGESVSSSSKALLKFMTSLNQGKTLKVPKRKKELQSLARAGAFQMTPK